MGRPRKIGKLAKNWPHLDTEFGAKSDIYSWLLYICLSLYDVGLVDPCGDSCHQCCHDNQYMW